MSAFTAYLRRVGIEFDIAVNVLTGGALGETVSERSAYGAGYRRSGNPAAAVRTGKRRPGWCFFCWFLNVVQRNHCALQFTNIPTPGFDMCRAGIAFAAGFLSLSAITRVALFLIGHIT